MRPLVLLFLVSCAEQQQPSAPKPAELPPVVLAQPMASDPPPAPKPITKKEGLAFDSINEQGRVELAGKVAIVDFWATWCGPCKKAFPKFEEIHNRHPDLVVIGLAMDDDKDDPLAFAQQMKTTFPIALDEGHALYAKLGLKVMPSTVLYDRSGKVRFKHEGYHDGEEADLEREVTQLLSE